MDAGSEDISNQDLCRICTKKATRLLPIFDQTQNIPDLVWLLAKVKIDNSDKLPQKICLECMTFAEHAFEFKQRCLNSDRNWENYVQKQRNKDQRSVVAKFEICMLEEPEVDSSTPEIKIKDEPLGIPSENDVNELNQDNEITKNDDNKPVQKRKGSAFDKKDRFAREVQCTKCNEMFANQSFLRLHINSDHADEDTPNEKKLRKCFFCPKEYSTFEYLGIHLGFHKRKIWGCVLCGRGIEKKCLFIDHLRMHANERHYKCDTCSRAFTSQSQLTAHRKTHIANEVKNNGTHDESEYIGVDALTRDENTSDRPIATENLDGKPATCSICKESFLYYKKLHFHLKSEHVPIDDSLPRIHQCVTCNRAFMTLEHLVYHMKFHKEKSWSCPSCNKQFRHLYWYKIHQLKHQNDPNVPCPYCGKFFLHKSNVNIHIKRHHMKQQEEAPKEEYVCEICGVRIKRKASYGNHMNTHGVKKLQKLSKTTNSADKGRFTCTLCGRQHRSLVNLEIHMRRHNGVSICSCLVCGKGFPRKHDLTVHMRNHTGDKPFQCPTCNMKFVTSPKLRIHMRVHTGEKPYACPCGRAYSQKQDLKAHKKRNTCGQNFDLNELNANSQWSILIQPTQRKNDSAGFTKQQVT
ncbi:zinc finger protein ZFP2-like [Sabethes cyaneus]|uniref:zinc finger protein ZFP2-like n=1 Tax=Sabethes cyaneus TaxID=53552 RepID=UPI00237E0E9E|nr:zinc finger protein ZFP2-like [Sabethes cyaneus]